MVVPSPFVYWAQTERAVSLKIDLKNVSEPDVKVLESTVKFSAQGIGAHGQSLYQFSLDLFSPVKSVRCELHIYDIFLTGSSTAL